MMRWLVLTALLAGCGTTGAECSDAELIGEWQGAPVQGNYAGKPVSQTFHDDGTYEIYLGGAIYKGVYSFATDGSMLTINDNSCNTSGDATYTIEFYADCREGILHIGADKCAGRSTTLNGMHIIKQ